MYRKFYLKNGIGNTFTLTDKNFKCFLNNPQGLGFIKTVNGYQLGNVTKITSSVYDFPTVSGEILFYDELGVAYQNYFDFINFISLEPIQLFYTPPNTLTPYYCNIEIIQGDKSEYGTNGILTVPISMQMTSRWYHSSENIIEVKKVYTEDGKHYELERPYHYANTSFSSIEIVNNGSENTGMIFEIDGNVTNPQWSISQSGVAYGSCKINGTYDYVRVNSRDGEQSIYLEKNGSAIANPSVYQDLTITGGVLTFIKLKTGTSICSFTCGNIESFDGVLKIKYFNTFISV